jgi:hypothetical protein
MFGQKTCEAATGGRTKMFWKSTVLVIVIPFVDNLKESLTETTNSGFLLCRAPFLSLTDYSRE